MLRRICTTLTLLAFTTTLAVAQTPATFHFNSGGGGYNSFQGYFAAGAAAPELAAGGFANGSSNAFQVWCVDEKHNISAGSQFKVNVTRLNSGDLSKTRAGNQDSYLKAAYLADGMGSSNVNHSQYAIWAIVHGKSLKNFCNDGLLNAIYVSSCDNSVNSLVSNAGANYGDMNPWEWYVITDQKQDKPGFFGFGGYHGYQELLARCQSNCNDPDLPTEDPTPEPATMTLLAIGLAGMAGTSLKRRRN